MAIETPRHAEFGCEEVHPGASHTDWITLEIKTGGTDNSDEAVFIGKITLPEPEQAEALEDVVPELCGARHPARRGVTCERPKGHDGQHNTLKEDLMKIDGSDAAKILDVLRDNEEYHIKRDEMNAAIHRSTERVRYSPITTETINQRERLEALMREAGLPL